MRLPVRRYFRLRTEWRSFKFKTNKISFRWFRIKFTFNWILARTRNTLYSLIIHLINSENRKNKQISNHLTSFAAVFKRLSGYRATCNSGRLSHVFILIWWISNLIGSLRSYSPGPGPVLPAKSVRLPEYFPKWMPWYNFEASTSTADGGL